MDLHFEIPEKKMKLHQISSPIINITIEQIKITNFQFGSVVINNTVHILLIDKEQVFANSHTCIIRTVLKYNFENITRRK